MKKFFDFECITIMVMAILLGPIYAIYFHSQEIREELNNLCGIGEEEVIYIGIGIFAIVNLVYIGIKIAKLISDYSDLTVYKKQERELGKIEEIDIEEYDLILGSFIFFKRFSINKLINAYKKYYKEKGYLVAGSIEESCVDKLPEIEKGMILMCADDVKLEDNDPMNLEGRCIDVLKEKKFLKHESIFRRVTKFCEGENGKYINVDYNKNPRVFLVSAIIITVMCVIFRIFGVYVSACFLPFIVVIIFFNSDKIVLSEEGRVERIKILNLIDNIERKEDLTEKEKLFLDIIK